MDALVLEAKRRVNELLNKGFFISPELIPKIEQHIAELEFILKNKSSIKAPLVIDENTLGLIKKKGIKCDWLEIEKLKAESELKKDRAELDKVLKNVTQPRAVSGFNVEIIKSFVDVSSDRKVEDFVGYFNSRYKLISSMLLNRPELNNQISIGRLKNKYDREQVSIIGLVREIAYTANNNIILTLEDPTGSINVIVTKKDNSLFAQASSITLDEVIGVNGKTGRSVVFASQIIWPDIPNIDIKRAQNEEYAIVLSDLHTGSKLFLEKEFLRFLRWINGELGNETQKRIANLTKYIFIAGDLVDGVGVYPEQFNELSIKDIYAQYNACAELLSRIPKDKAVIVCPGNHDALRLAEPQPPLNPELAKKLYSIPNIIMVSNPALVNIAKTNSFPGFNVLMYHGYSFDYYVSNIEQIRNNGGYDKPEIIMQYMLKRRHLAPSHGSTLYVPYSDKDPLVIENVPDFFVTGHIHKSSIYNIPSKNVTLICGSCWQAKTSFQEKVGHEPEPCRVPIINLKTRKMKLLKFGG